jgi:hypothetical protein
MSMHYDSPLKRERQHENDILSSHIKLKKLVRKILYYINISSESLKKEHLDFSASSIGTGL